jgi:hypothetical protein
MKWEEETKPRCRHVSRFPLDHEFDPGMGGISHNQQGRQRSTIWWACLKRGTRSHVYRLEPDTLHSVPFHLIFYLSVTFLHSLQSDIDLTYNA